MFNKSKHEKNTFGIIGLGRFGMALALDLANTGEEIVVLDKSEEKVCTMREYTENAYVVPSLDKKTLSETGIHNCDVVVVCIGEQLDTSILTTLNLVSMGVKKVIAKANSIEHGEILQKLGAEIVFPEQDMALRLSSMLKSANVIDFVQLSEKINISKLNAPACIVGKTVIDVNFRGKFNLNIVAIENNGEVIEIVASDYTFKKDDILYLAGSRDGLSKLLDWFEKKN